MSTLHINNLIESILSNGTICDKPSCDIDRRKEIDRFCEVFINAFKQGTKSHTHVETKKFISVLH